MDQLDSISGQVHPHLSGVRFTTLLAMLQAYASHFFNLATVLGRCVDEAEFGRGIPRVPVRSNRVLMGTCRELREACAGLDLQLTVQSLDRFLTESPETLPPNDLAAAIKGIRLRAIDELKTRNFLYLTPAEVSMYQNEYPIGREVQERFPKIGIELTEGAKCKALGRHLAAVFHFGRALEYGLRQFVDKLKVEITTSKPTWFTYLSGAKQKIDAMPEKKPAEKKKKEPYQRVYDAFDSVRVAWRNPTAHDLDLNVTQDDSENLLARTKQVFDMLLPLLPKKRT